MDWAEYRRQFEAEARRQERSDDFVISALAYAERLFRDRLPIIFDTAHLASILGFDEAVFVNAIKEPSSLYSSYRIPKHGAGYRQIDEPVPSLKEAQLWILRRILANCNPHKAATAFFRDCSIKRNAESHVEKRMVLSIDVKDFFPSIRGVRVARVFRSLGYSDEVAETLTNLTVVRDGLPQGAPTSPALSNLAMVEADKRLAAYAQKLSIRYSRYADDITFSGQFKVGRVIELVRKVLCDQGLVINESKTRLMLPHERQEVTGVVVNQRLQAPRELRRALRQQIHYIEKFGIEGHEERKPFVGESLLHHVRGIADFILFLNPEDRDARKAIAVLSSIRR